MQREVGIGLVVAGLLLFIVPVNIFGLLTVVVDTTPPVIMSTYPGASATLASVTEFNMITYDPDDPVVSGWVVPSWAPSSKVTMQADFYNPDIWSAKIVDPKLAPGTYQLTWYATDSHGNTNTGYVTSLTISAAATLKGSWYINGNLLDPTTTTYKAISNTLKFEFRKAPDSTVADSSISASVICNTLRTVATGGCGGITGNQALTLTDSINHVWGTSLTFKTGTYALDLRAAVPADPNAGSVVLSIAGTLGTESLLGLISMQQVVGILMSIVGVGLFVRGKDEA